MSMRNDALKAANERDYRLSDGLQPLYLEEMLARLCDWADRQDAPKAEPKLEASSSSLKVTLQSEYDKETCLDALLLAVRDYIVSLGGKALVAGAVSIEQDVGGRDFQYRLVVHFTGTLPKINKEGG